jgi:hypothetical protein
MERHLVVGVGDKIGDVYLRGAKVRVHAYWRPADGPDIYLGSISRGSMPTILTFGELFTELISEVAVNLKREKGSGVTLRTREPLPTSFCYPLL